jgi:ribose 5-phosphate isomerase B
MAESIDRERFGTLARANLSDQRYPSKSDLGTSRRAPVRRVALGADHGGYEVKETLKHFLSSEGYEVVDFGTNSSVEKVDYPDFAFKVAKSVARGDCERGVMVDAMGIGSSMVCNKVRGVRAALCYDMASIKNSRLHNNANVLTLGANAHNLAEICEMVREWLTADFEGGRHWPRINKMMAVERRIS